VTEQSIAEAAAAVMSASDHHIRELGIEIVAVGPGTAVASMVVRPEMVNGLATCHGGVIFSLADAAFGYACNSHGGTAVASGASIEFVSAAYEGDQLRADANESHVAGRTGHYDIVVSRENVASRENRVSGDDTIIALFKGRSRRISDGATAP